MTTKVEEYDVKNNTVTAYQWDGSVADMYFLIGWVVENGGVAWVQNEAGSRKPECPAVETKRSVAIVEADSWVVRDYVGQFEVFTDTEFHGKYEKRVREKNN